MLSKFDYPKSTTVDPFQETSLTQGGLSKESSTCALYASVTSKAGPIYTQVGHSRGDLSKGNYCIKLSKICSLCIHVI